MARYRNPHITTGHSAAQLAAAVSEGIYGYNKRYSMTKSGHQELDALVCSDLQPDLQLQAEVILLCSPGPVTP